MAMAEQSHLDVEPEDEAMALVRALPEGFDLPLLLRFLPDVRLKQAVVDRSEVALAIDVQEEGGFKAADEAVALVRESITEIEECFKLPTDLANQVHKRLTGLRSDFCKHGKEVIDTVNGRIRTESRRLETLAQEQRRKDQAEADRQTRATADAAAKDAAKNDAPAPVVAALEQAAKTATAPPLSALTYMPSLGHSSVTQKWRARLVGTDPVAVVQQPKISEMTAEQIRQVKNILRAIADDKLPLAACAGLDWSYLNKRAEGEKSTFSMLELEAYDEGGTRAKPKKKRV